MFNLLLHGLDIRHDLRILKAKDYNWLCFRRVIKVDETLWEAKKSEEKEKICLSQLSMCEVLDY
jgi:hypothetical protein